MLNAGYKNIFGIKINELSSDAHTEQKIKVICKVFTNKKNNLDNKKIIRIFVFHF
jgi:hypothetical protein